MTADDDVADPQHAHGIFNGHGQGIRVICGYGAGGGDKRSQPAGKAEPIRVGFRDAFGEQPRVRTGDEQRGELRSVARRPVEQFALSY